MQISFRLLSQAIIIGKYKKSLDEEYSQEREKIRQTYLLHMKRLREEYAPKYRSLEVESDLLWDGVKEETGIENGEAYRILDDGTVTPVNTLNGDLW